MNTERLKQILESHFSIQSNNEIRYERKEEAQRFHSPVFIPIGGAFTPSQPSVIVNNNLGDVKDGERKDEKKKEDKQDSNVLLYTIGTVALSAMAYFSSGHLFRRFTLSEDIEFCESYLSDTLICRTEEDAEFIRNVKETLYLLKLKKKYSSVSNWALANYTMLSLAIVGGMSYVYTRHNPLGIAAASTAMGSIVCESFRFGFDRAHKERLDQQVKKLYTQLCRPPPYNNAKQN